MKLSYVNSGAGEMKVSVTSPNCGSPRAVVNFGDATVYVQHEDIPELIHALQEAYFALSRQYEQYELAQEAHELAQESN